MQLQYPVHASSIKKNYYLKKFCPIFWLPSTLPDAAKQYHADQWRSDMTNKFSSNFALIHNIKQLSQLVKGIFTIMVKK
jgi:hypothetical protein